MTEGDLPGQSEIRVLSFYENPRALSYYIFPHNPEAGLADWSLRSCTFNYHNSPDENFYKLVDTASGVMVAFASWMFPKDVGTPEERAAKKEQEDEIKSRRMWEVGWPPGTNEKQLDTFHTEQARLRQKNLDPGKDFILSYVAVRPDYQGRGCGKMLIEHGLKIVDAARGRAYLEATPQAMPIYMKYGWREVDRITHNVPTANGNHNHVTTCMLRDAYATKS